MRHPLASPTMKLSPRVRTILPIFVVGLSSLLACDILDENHYGPSSAGNGFAATHNGDFYAVNSDGAVRCFVNGNPYGIWPTDGNIWRPSKVMSTAYKPNTHTETIWAHLALGNTYQTAWDSKYNYFVQFNYDCKPVNYAILPAPPQGHDYWVYDITVTDDGTLFVLVDDTVSGGQDSYRIFKTTDFVNWVEKVVSPSEQASLASTCFAPGVTEISRMAWDRGQDEIVLLACDKHVRYDTTTLDYRGTRKIDIDIKQLYDFDVFAGASVVSYRDTSNTSRVSVVSPFGPIMDERVGHFMSDVHFTQPTIETFSANPWGIRYWANGYDPSWNGTRIHRYRAEGS